MSRVRARAVAFSALVRRAFNVFCHPSPETSFPWPCCACAASRQKTWGVGLSDVIASAYPERASRAVNPARAVLRSRRSSRWEFHPAPRGQCRRSTRRDIFHSEMWARSRAHAEWRPSAGRFPRGVSSSTRTLWRPAVPFALCVSTQFSPYLRSRSISPRLRISARADRRVHLLRGWSGSAV